MDTEVVFTLHAQQKFAILRRHGIELSQSRVREIVLSPERTDKDSLGHPIAQGQLDETHVLRVVYRVEQKNEL